MGGPGELLAHGHLLVRGREGRRPPRSGRHLLGIPVDTTSHHQGAGNATAQQARWLQCAGRVFIVADRDAPGAYDAATRYDLLIEAGYKGEIAIVRAREGKDAADHCDAGDYADQLVPVDMQRLEEAARRYAGERKSNGDRYAR